MELNVKLDLTQLNLGDVEILSDTTGKFSMTQKIEVLERACPDTDVRKIPLLKLPELMDMIGAELGKVTNPT